MHKLNIYLSGATKNVNNSFQNWRKNCSLYQSQYEGLNFVNPIRYFDYKTNCPTTNKQCQDLFMWQLDHSDIVLVNLDYSDVSCGTCMELEHAFLNNIPIIGFGDKSNTWYSWAAERASIIFDSLEEAIWYINDYYADSILK